MKRRAARKDANHNAIQTAFERLGWSVADTSALGDGFPDLLAAKHQETIAVEVKDGAKPPSARKLTPDEVKFAGRWQGWYAVVTCEADVLALNQRVIRKQTGAA